MSATGPDDAKPLSRRQLLLLAPAGVLAAGLAGTAGWLLTRRDGPVPIGGPFDLVDGDGRPVTDRAFRGKWMLVYFGFTHCPDACPLALQNLAAALDQLGPGRDRVALVFITLDPERDTPAVMRDYVSGFDVPMAALTGSPEQVAKVAKEYRVYYAKVPTKDGDYSVDHTSIVYAMDPQGQFAANFTHETPPEEVAERLRKLI